MAWVRVRVGLAWVGLGWVGLGSVGLGWAGFRRGEARVVEGGEAAAKHDEEQAGQRVRGDEVARDEEDGQHVVILAWVGLGVGVGVGVGLGVG